VAVALDVTQEIQQVQAVLVAVALVQQVLVKTALQELLIVVAVAVVVQEVVA
jgi:hypothetical protein